MNIEKTISEHAVADILTPMLESQDRIVTEDVAPLFDAATGLDTPPASGSVTTTIEESRSVITAIIRRAWTAPLTMLGGASVLSSIAAAYTYLRNRLQGNETYGIPDRRSEISASSPLAANLALLNDRKIGGVPEAADGMSLVHLLCDTSEITELTDDNTGWTHNRTYINLFSNLQKVKLGCETLTRCIASGNNTLTEIKTPNLRVINNDSGGNGFIVNCPNVVDIDCSNLETFYCRYDSHINYAFGPIKGMTEIVFDKLTSAYVQGNCSSVFMFTECKVLRFPELTTIPYIGNAAWLSGLPMLEELYIPKPIKVNSAAGWPTMISNLPNLKVLELGVNSITTMNSGSCVNLSASTNLLLLKIGEGQNTNLNLSTWSPTLDSSNLQQFLQNFRDVLFTRLAKRTSTTSLTLTLSQAVYKAVYGLDADYNVDPDALAQTASLADFGITTEDLNEIEIAAGITTATKYATWLDTYRGAIYWNVQHS